MVMDAYRARKNTSFPCHIGTSSYFVECLGYRTLLTSGIPLYVTRSEGIGVGDRDGPADGESSSDVAEWAFICSTCLVLPSLASTPLKCAVRMAVCQARKIS